MKTLICLLSGMLLIACGPKDISVKKYYFPYVDLTTPKVYAFVNTSDTSQRTYWHLRTEIQNTDTILGIHILNNDCEVTHILFNQITEDGVRLKRVIHISQNRETIQYTITRDEVLQWKIKPSDKLYVSFGAEDSTGTESQEIMIEKSFTDKKKEVIFSGKKYSSIGINELSTLNIQTPNRTKSEEQQRTGFYAEGLGLIRFETSSTDGSVTTMTLEKIMNINDFEILRQSKNIQQE